MNELAIDYAITIFILVLAAVTGVLAYQIGSYFGYQRGWQDGLHRGLRFGRLKLHEQEHNDRNSML